MEYGVGVNLSCGAVWCCGQSSLPCVDMKDNGSGSAFVGQQNGDIAV